jgi:hypothetical protein
MRDDSMLDREVVKDFLLEELKEASIDIPENIDKRKLVEAFCRFTEDDYYEWLKDNFKSFFNHGNPDWSWIKERIAEVKDEATEVRT